MSRSRIARALRAEDGMTLIEVMVAASILVGGLVATFMVLDGSRELATVSERKEVMVHRAEDELERIRAIPYAALELTALPGAATAGDLYDPRAGVSGSTYDWDQSSATNPAEPLVVKDPAATNPDAVTPRTSWTDGRYGGTLDVFVTNAGTDLKRVTVAVRLNGSEEPRRPILLSTFVSRQANP